MRGSKQHIDLPGDNISFFNGFVRHPQRVGSIIPSSRFLKKHLIDLAGMDGAEQVIELGPGTGGTTRAFLKALPPRGRLLAIEIDPEFVQLLQQIKDPRFSLHQGSAFDLLDIIAEHHMRPADVIISGIPFSTMPELVAQATLEAISEALGDNGKFIAYQFRDKVAKLGERFLGPAHVELELRNVPPLHIYSWHKH